MTLLEAFVVGVVAALLLVVLLIYISILFKGNK